MLFRALYRFFNPTSKLLVDSETELVFDAFPRSGQSFAVFTFVEIQGRPVPIANHVHAPCQFAEAAKRGLPACLLVRPPEDAVAALIEKIPHLREADLFRAYAVYYRAALRYRDHYVVAIFADVVTDFGAVIDRINVRFGTSFRSIRRDELPAYVERFRKTEHECLRRIRLPYLRPEDVGALTRTDFRHATTRLRDRCNELYASFEALASAVSSPGM